MCSKILKLSFIILFQLGAVHAQKVITIEHEGSQDHIIKTIKIISDKSVAIKDPEPQNYVEKIVFAHQNQRMILSDSLFGVLYLFIEKQAFYTGQPTFVYGSFSIGMQNDCPLNIHYLEPPLSENFFKNIITFLTPIGSLESQKLIKECKDYLFL